MARPRPRRRRSEYARTLGYLPRQVAAWRPAQLAHRGAARAVGALVALALLAGCTSSEPEPAPTPSPTAPPPAATPSASEHPIDVFGERMGVAFDSDEDACRLLTFVASTHAQSGADVTLYAYLDQRWAVPPDVVEAVILRCAAMGVFEAGR